MRDATPRSVSEAHGARGLAHVGASPIVRITPWSMTGIWNLLRRTPGRNSHVPSVGSSTPPPTMSADIFWSRM